MRAVQTTVLRRIRGKGRGKVFTSKDFLDLGSREAVDQALSRLAKAGDVQRLGRGLYHYPRVNRRLGIQLPPDADDVAAALARRVGARIAPSGALAANRLGLSTQVPAKLVYLTDGRSRRVKAANAIFLIQHVAPKDLPVGSPTSAAVFQALRYVGEDAVDDQVIARLRRALTAKDRRKLLEDARYATGWIAETVRQVAAGSPAKEVAHG